MFTPFTVRPQVVSTAQVQEALRRGYPRELRDAGIGGSVIVGLFVGVDGVVQNQVVEGSSGNPVLDQAALEVARGIRFTPAMSRDQVVAVWVAFPLTFRP